MIDRQIWPRLCARNTVSGAKQGDCAHRYKYIQLSEEYSIAVNPDSAIWQLSIGEQRVEILKVLYRKADILILDEPTAVLTPSEVRDLFRALREMPARGCTVIFITRKMNEVAFAD